MARTQRADRPRRRKRTPGAQMELREHLREFRNRLIKSAVATLAGMVGGFFLYDPAMQAIQAPLHQIAQDPSRNISINYSAVGSPFDLMVQVSLTIGVILASPVWLYQLWAYILPALHRKEKAYALAFFCTSVLLFLGGVVIAWLCMPAAVIALTVFTPEGGDNFIDAKTYIAFVLRLLLAFGVAFVLPVVLVGLNMMGLIRGRTILKSWRWVVVLVALLAAIAAPGSDVLTMFYLMAPLLILFFLAIGLCLWGDRRRDRRAAAALADAGVSSDAATPEDQLRTMGR
ncbi:twin-arginine translocase subunit TatC [Rothia kristinae]|uniref:twin-arginine translocase subunit TatC n=1 Tax=Rothia kristinae TaxID=37923 RepID=UPI0022E6BB0A|nr:twin-arginine translocase subunit TatC [Rothia kristinae]